MLKKIVAVLLSTFTAAALAVPLGSQSVLVVEDDTGKVILEKNADVQVPIASLTKLMTAMVVLDAKQDMKEAIEIDRADVDMLKHSASRVPVGASIARANVLQLALMSSDNRAAASLARTYPGGMENFRRAVNAKIHALGLTHTVIEEPTGLSPHNRSTATDLVKMAHAASLYPEITRITTDKRDLINIKGRDVEYHNTNRLVGAKGWDVGLSKTGYTEEAGRCLIMRFRSGGKNNTLVLLNAKANSARLNDAVNIRRLIVGPEARSLEQPRLLKASARVRAERPKMVKAAAKVKHERKAKIVKTSVKTKKHAVKASRRESREM
ncbi:peptidase S11 [Duganella sp. Leaf126]|uniref:serine hydrolase n=1 Tax=Duganella sp. Leaf126 TaxID=1736266 RepID=UPI0006F5ECCB|nr:serine hydrolase [Duganella sp. Leaf126]KQQ36149.1 peptidase S11 [Duganella sp. Leaf126]